MPDEPIRIKRYPNRRFYASHTSKYVSLAEIEQMIRDGLTVEIVDSQTNEDLTRSVLVQIIADNHPDKIALFPPAMLHSILRANDAMSQFLGEYFRQSLSYLDYFQAQAKSAPVEQPMNWMKAWFEQWSNLPRANSAPNSTASPADHGERALSERIASLEQRIAEFEREGDRAK